jgi:tripartite-type tricarboxylate transporter receptor subunit TctC
LGIFVPAGTPQPVIDRLHKELAAALKDAAVRDRFIANGFEPQSSTPEEFGRLVREEIEKWRPIVKMSGATAD